MTQDPGWFTDPSGALQQRYWDGDAWTERIRPYPPPGATSEGAVPAPALASSPGGGTAPVVQGVPVAPAPATPERRGSGWIPIVAVLVAVLGVLGFVLWRNSVDSAARRAAAVGALLGNSGGGTSYGNSFPSSQQVTYKVSVNGYSANAGGAGADVTYETPSGTQQGEVPDGWSRTFTFDAGDFVYVSAQNNGQGTVTCTIEVDGRILSTNSSTGEFMIATCDGRAG